MAENTNLSTILNSELEKFEAALPCDFNREKFVHNSITLCMDKPELAEFKDKLQIYNCLMKGAFLNLDFMNGDAYVVQYGTKLNFQTSYKGEIKLAERYSTRPVKDIYAKVIREGDTFKEKIVDGQPSIDFEALPLSNNKIIGVFAVCLFMDGGMIYEVMTSEEVENVRKNYSKAANSPAWKNSWGEMARKTVLRRLIKHIPMDFESIEAKKAWEDGGDNTFKRSEGLSEEEKQEDVFATVEAQEV